MNGELKVDKSLRHRNAQWRVQHWGQIRLSSWALLIKTCNCNYKCSKFEGICDANTYQVAHRCLNIYELNRKLEFFVWFRSNGCSAEWAWPKWKKSFCCFRKKTFREKLKISTTAKDFPWHYCSWNFYLLYSFLLRYKVPILLMSKVIMIKLCLKRKNINHKRRIKTSIQFFNVRIQPSSIRCRDSNSRSSREDQG